VYSELLDFSGDEIYFASVPELEGSAFGDVLCSFEDSSVVGIAAADGNSHLNPGMDRRIGPGDRIIAISADDDTIRLRTDDAPAVDEGAIVQGPPRASAPETTLLLGWNRRATSIARELDAYVARGSKLTIVTDDPLAAQPAVDLRVELTNQEVRFVPRSPSDRSVLDRLEADTYDHVIVLSPIDRLDPQRADAHTLVTLLHLRDIASRVGHRFSIVSEMADVRNRALAEITRADDFIVSDRLTSLILTQIAENKQLHAVFTDLFDAAGSEIYLRPAGDYVAPGREVNYATVLEAARRRGEVAMGYRLRALAGDAARAYGVRVNPPKSERVSLGEGDRIIVLAEG
jgi:voltage-gated potassium channel Kch